MNRKMFDTPTALLLSLIYAATATAEVDFTKDIQPIFKEHCANCHGEKKGLGKLRLHTVAAIQEKWSKDEHLLVAGEPEKSELYERLVLPEDNKKRMPKKADPLPEAQIALIRQWIEQGAVLPESASSTESKPIAEEEALHEEQAGSSASTLPEVAAAPAEAVESLVAAGAQVQSLYAGSPLLQVSFALRDEPANDDDIALLASVAEQVFSLNLAGSTATEAGFARLAQLKNLRTLHAELSSISDASLQHLAELASLEYLNLYGTQVSDTGLAHLEGLPALKKLYLWQAPISYEVAMALQEKIAGLTVNLGHDHPVIMRQNLTKELDQLKEQLKEVKEEVTQHQQKLEQAQSYQKKIKERRDEVKKALEGLEGSEPPQEESEQPTEG